MITAEQIKAARALLRWRQRDLAQASNLAEITIRIVEQGKTDPRISTIIAIQKAFDQAGLIFLDPGDTRDGGRGVRLKE